VGPYYWDEYGSCGEAKGFSFMVKKMKAMNNRIRTFMLLLRTEPRPKGISHGSISQGNLRAAIKFQPQAGPLETLVFKEGRSRFIRAHSASLACLLAATICV
jgi:hypothetical protein